MLAKRRVEEEVLRQARERVQSETGGEVSYVRKSMLAQQKRQQQENR